MAEDGARRPAVEVLRIRPTLGSIFLVIAAISSAFLLATLFGSTRRVLAWAFATVVVAWLASAIIALLDRRMPRGLALLLTILFLVVIGAGTWVGVVATVRSEVVRIRTSLPEAARHLEEEYEVAADFRLAERVDAFVADLNQRFSTREAVSRAAETAPVYFVTGILMLFFVGYGPRFVSAALNQIADPVRRGRVAAVVGRASRRARGYLLFTIAQVIATALLSAAVFFVLGVRAPFLLGLIVGLLGAIPYFGFVLGGLAALVVAAADPNELVLIAVVALVVGLQLVEVVVVRHRVDQRTLRVGPALLLIVGILSFDLYGLGGIVYGGAALVATLALLDALAVHPLTPAKSPAPST